MTNLKEVQNLKIKTAKELDIPSLLNYRSEYLTGDFLDKFIEVSRSVKPIIKEYNDFLVANDILYSSQILSYTLAELNVFKPYLRDFLEDPLYMGDKKVYRYFPSFYDNQYFSIASNYIQALYNYWDKLGDLLYYFFDVGLSERHVYFYKVIDKFPAKYKNP